MDTQSKSSVFLWTSIVAILLLVVVGIYFAVSSPDTRNGAPQATTILETLSQDEWIKGNPLATTTLIEYADFQCPGCAAFSPVLRQLQSEMGSDLRIIYRHFPLGNHANARIAARAAEAAGKQGKFWEMHDMLFETQKNWERSGSADKLFVEYAQTLGLNTAQFDKDMRSKEIGDKIQAHYESGLRFGVNSTPTFFLNDTKMAFPRTYEELKGSVQAAINQTKGININATTTATTTRSN